MAQRYACVGGRATPESARIAEWSPAISRIERDESNPTVDTVARLLLPLGARLAVTPVESKVG